LGISDLMSLLMKTFTLEMRVLFILLKNYKKNHILAILIFNLLGEIMNIFNYLHSHLNKFIAIQPENFFLSIVFFLFSLFTISLFYKFFNHIFVQNFRGWLGKSNIKYGNLLIKNNLISRFVKLIFAILLSKIALSLPNPTVSEYSNLIASLFIIYFSAGMLFSVFDAGHDIFKTRKASDMLPLHAIAQVLKLFVVIGAVIFAVAYILGKSPLILLSGIGAFSAVLMLVFKDSILNLVAIFQIRLQKSIDVGDWIEMPKYGADGDVSEINLSGIEVVNWDKTTTIVPPAAFLSNSFKNYKSMSNTARRIKRKIYIDINSVQFLTDEKINKLNNIPTINHYISIKKNEINVVNKDLDSDSIPFKGKALTNIGTFRKYIEEYLKNNEHISNEQTILVRQLEASEKGIPIELYCFTSNTAWMHFESVQSDIFDHLFAVVSYFDLKVYQEPSGNDIKKVMLIKQKI